MKKNLLLIVVCLTGASCLVNKEKRDIPIACTEEFRTISVLLINEKGEPVLNASTYTVNQTGDTLLTTQTGFYPGSYVVLSDNEKNRLGNQPVNIRFEAFIDSLTTNGSFQVSADACHISYISGPDTLVLTTKKP